MLGYGYDDISALRDMFDGGGAGQAGDEFQGGGILSLLANMLASPYGSQQEDDQLARTIAEQASPRPQLAPDSSMRPQMRAEQMTTGEELMSGDDVALPAYDGREEAFLLPGAFAPSSQNTPSTPRDRDAPSNLPNALLAPARTGGGMMPGSAAPDDANAPSVPGMTVPAANAGEAETALNMFRRGLVSPESSAYGPLAQRVVDRGTPEQIADLKQILQAREAVSRRREMSAEELSRGGNSPLASTLSSDLDPNAQDAAGRGESTGQLRAELAKLIELERQLIMDYNSDPNAQGAAGLRERIGQLRAERTELGRSIRQLISNANAN